MPRARTSLLPPLFFQLPTDPQPSESPPQPAFSVTAPTRPLLRRSQSTSTSMTSSPFFSRSTADSSLFPQTSTSSSMGCRGTLATCGSPLNSVRSIESPDVPPIPEKWKATNRAVHSAPRPARLRPFPNYWQYGSSLDGSSSWVTATPSSSDKRDLSRCRLPSPPGSPKSSIRTESKDSIILNDRVGRRRSYESLRKGGACQPFSSAHTDAKWSGLDDREDPRSWKRPAKAKECRTLVKRRQP